jgi:hypothetical protein
VETSDQVIVELVLATTNDATLTKGACPTAREISEAWNGELGGSAKYFGRNQESGI